MVRRVRSLPVSAAAQASTSLRNFSSTRVSTILPEVIEGTRGGYRLLASPYPYQGDSQAAHHAPTPMGRRHPAAARPHACEGRGPDGHQFHVGVDTHDYAPIPLTVIDEWIQAIPGIETRLQAAIREAREVVASHDDISPCDMEAMYYMQGYQELRIALEELLDALGAPLHRGGDGRDQLPAATGDDERSARGSRSFLILRSLGPAARGESYGPDGLTSVVHEGDEQATVRLSVGSWNHLVDRPACGRPLVDLRRRLRQLDRLAIVHDKLGEPHDLVLGHALPLIHSTDVALRRWAGERPAEAVAR